MTINQALDHVLGQRLATAIINDQGLHWAVVAATAAALKSHDPRAIAAIREYNAEMRKKYP